MVSSVVVGGEVYDQGMVVAVREHSSIEFDTGMYGTLRSAVLRLRPCVRRLVIWARAESTKG